MYIYTTIILHVDHFLIYLHIEVALYKTQVNSI